MKRLFLPILIIILIVLAIFFTFIRKNSTLFFTDTKFSVQNPESISLVNIDNGHSSIKIAKVQADWYIDDLRVKTEVINFLLKLASQIEMVSPVSGTQKNQVMNLLKNGTEITFIYSSGKSYSLRLCQNEDGIFASHNKSKTPFRIEFRGYPGIDVSKIMSTDKSLWLRNNLFNFASDKIISINLVRFDNPDKSFEMEKQPDSSYLIIDRHDKILLNKIRADFVNDYLGFFNSINYNKIRLDTGKIATSLVPKNKLFQLIIKDNYGLLIDLQGYKKIDVLSGQLNPFEFYAVSNKTGVIALIYSDFDPILEGHDYFLKK